jgi:hypothetical protein
MIPVLQLFKIESTSGSYYKQRAVIEFLVTVKETVGNTHKQLSNVYGNAAFNRSTVGCWTK